MRATSAAQGAFDDARSGSAGSGKPDAELDCAMAAANNVHMHRVNPKGADGTPGLTASARHATTGACACFKARRQARILSRLYDAALAPHGVTSGQFSLLAAVAGAGSTTVQALADVMAMDHSTTSRGVVPLVRSGWLGAAADPADARKRVLHLTEAGRNKFNAAASAWAKVQDTMEAGATS